MTKRCPFNHRNACLGAACMCWIGNDGSDGCAFAKAGINLMQLADHQRAPELTDPAEEDQYGKFYRKIKVEGRVWNRSQPLEAIAFAKSHLETLHYMCHVGSRGHRDLAAESAAAIASLLKMIGGDT